LNFGIEQKRFKATALHSITVSDDGRTLDIVFGNSKNAKIKLEIASVEMHPIIQKISGAHSVAETKSNPSSQGAISAMTPSQTRAGLWQILSSIFWANPNRTKMVKFKSIRGGRDNPSTPSEGPETKDMYWRDAGTGQFVSRGVEPTEKIFKEEVSIVDLGFEVWGLTGITQIPICSQRQAQLTLYS
jgi:hypothetical protein